MQTKRALDCKVWLELVSESLNVLSLSHTGATSMHPANKGLHLPDPYYTSVCKMRYTVAVGLSVPAHRQP